MIRHGFFFQTGKAIFELLKPNPIIDYVCKIDGTKVGVSVTRAMKFCEGYPGDDVNRYRGNFTYEDAKYLLERNLSGIEGELILRMGDFVQISF